MPRKIIGSAFVSLDGVMQAPGGPEEDTQGGFAHGGWMAPLFEEAVGHQVNTLFAPPFDLLLGRRTYDIFASHWPFMPADDPIRGEFREDREVRADPLGRSARMAGQPPARRHGRARGVEGRGGSNLVIQGSSTLYPQLLECGLLDRLVLMAAPITLGAGKRLFGEGTPAGAFKLVEQRQTPGGLLMPTYEPDGPLQTGSFEMEPPTEQELVMRKKMEESAW